MEQLANIYTVLKVKIKMLLIIFIYHFFMPNLSEREGTMECLIHRSPNYCNNVFLFVGLTTLGTFDEF